MPRARLQRAAPERHRPPGRGDRGRRPRPGRGRDAAAGGRARRRSPRDDRRARSTIAGRRCPMSEPTAYPAVRPRLIAARADRRDPRRRDRRPRRGPLGDDRRARRRRRSTASSRRRRSATSSTGGRSSCGGPTTASSRSTTRSRTPRSRRPTCSRSARSSGESGTGGSGRRRVAGRGPASPIRGRQRPPDPRRRRDRRGSRPGLGRGALRRGAPGRRARRGRRRPPGVRPRAARRRTGRAHPVASSRAPRRSTERSRCVGVPAPTHVEPHVARVTLNPRLVAGGADRRRRRPRRGEGRRSSADVLGRRGSASALPAQLARRAGATWILDQAAARLRL